MFEKHLECERCMSVISNNDVVVSSFFDRVYATLLGVEVKDYICKTRKCPRRKLIEALRERGYKTNEISKELDRQCCCSTLRFLPSEKAYTCVDIGMTLWNDICRRIYDQKSLIAGRLQPTGSNIKLDVYRTDFQSPSLKKEIRSLGLHRAPVMWWTKKFQEKEALKCLKRLVGVLPLPVQHDKEACSGVLPTVSEVVSQKPRKAPWAWLVTHPVAQLELDPLRKKVLETLFLLSNGPVNWKGIPVSLDELQLNTSFSRDEIKESIAYLEEHGITRQVGEDFTPTNQGYVLLRRAFRSDSSITFAVTCSADMEYQLEISTPSYLNPEMCTLLKIHGGAVCPEFHTPAVFSHCEGSRVTHILDAIMELLLTAE